MPAGGSAAIPVTFKPATTGSLSGTLSFLSDDPSTPNASVALSGVGATFATTVLSKSFDLNQVISFTGTSVTTGSQGAFVPVIGSSSTFALPRSQDLEFRFDFWFTYSSGPSTMMLDLRFVLDGMATAATRVPTSAKPQLRLILPSVLTGSHTLTVEVRSVLVDGPPTDVTLYGNSDAYFFGGPGTAKLEVEGTG